MQHLSDEDLLNQVRSARNRGEPEAKWIDELFQRYQSRVALWCYRFTGDRESAADLAQEIFLRVYRNLDSFQGSSKFSTWLYTVARNHCVNDMKSRRSQLHGASANLDFEVEDPAAFNVLAALEQEQSMQAVRSLIEENLDPMEKKVMVMHFAHGVGLASVSRLLGLTNASGARAYIVSAKRKLARARERWKAS